MDKELNKKSLMLGIPGIILQLAGNVIVKMNPDLVLVGVGVAIVGTVLLIIGLSWYARAKGYHSAFGLFGLLGCIGLIVLAVLPDKNK